MFLSQNKKTKPEDAPALQGHISSMSQEPGAVNWKFREQYGHKHFYKRKNNPLLAQFQKAIEPVMSGLISEQPLCQLSPTGIRFFSTGFANNLKQLIRAFEYIGYH